METDLIYWSHIVPPGIKVEEISGMENRSGALWIEMAKQIYAEKGNDNYREIGHFQTGAPFVYGLPARISVTHTSHLLAIASLPKTPDADLSYFNPRTAMGIDAEALDRDQVLKVRDRFLSDEEKSIIPADSLLKNIQAWTAKEALYKAAMTPGLDFKNDISLISLPTPANPLERTPFPEAKFGKASLNLPESNPDSPGLIVRKRLEMNLYSYESEGCCITLAFSPKCALFHK